MLDALFVKFDADIVRVEARAGSFEIEIACG
jgi:hypothetical protein